MKISLSLFAPEKLVPRGGFGRPGSACSFFTLKAESGTKHSGHTVPPHDVDAREVLNAFTDFSISVSF